MDKMTFGDNEKVKSSGNLGIIQGITAAKKRCFFVNYQIINGL